MKGPFRGVGIQEAAEYLGVDYNTVYRLVNQGEIPASRVGSSYRILREDLDAYFEQQKRILAEKAARTAQLECGFCRILMAPYEVGGSCEEPGCDRALCRECWENFPDHRCEPHSLTPEGRLRKAQLELADGKIPLLLTSSEARQRELFYLSRVEAKLRGLESIPHPETGRQIRISNWSAIGSRVEQLNNYRERLVRYPGRDRASRLPTGPQHTYQLDRRLILELAVYSDLATHLRLGFVTQPTAANTLIFELLNPAIDRARERDSIMILGLAATAGWEEAAVALIEGQMPFYSHQVAPVLIDLSTGKLAFNDTDERLDHLASILSPETTMDEIRRAMHEVEAMFEDVGTKNVWLREVVRRTRVSESVVASAFERLAAAMPDYEVLDKGKPDCRLQRQS